MWRQPQKGETNEGNREDRDHAFRPGGLSRGRQGALRDRQEDDRARRQGRRRGLRRRVPDGRRRHLGRAHAARVPHEQVRRPRPRGLPDPRRRVERHGPQAHDREVRRAHRLRVRHHPRGGLRTIFWTVTRPFPARRGTRPACGRRAHRCASPYCIGRSSPRAPR